MIEASEELGREMGKVLVETLGSYEVQSYGKVGIAGLAGEQEQSNALLTTTFANPLREAVGGGKAWISSFTKRAAPGVPIDVPLAVMRPNVQRVLASIGARPSWRAIPSLWTRVRSS